TRSKRDWSSDVCSSDLTIVGATTRAGLLPGPLRDRFGFTGHLDFYSTGELELVLRRSAAMLDMRLNSAAFTEIASRSRGTPRIADRKSVVEGKRGAIRW